MVASSEHPSVANVCPAFTDGCPYANNGQILEWIKAKRSDAIRTCPAFQEGCPFNAARDLDALSKELQKLPASHAGVNGGVAHRALLEVLQAVHQASQSVKHTVGGDCPVFQDACPFKNCDTSSSSPLVLELETRTWGLMIHEGLREEPPAGLAGMLKEGTREAHKAAETVHFVHEFIKGRVPREIYGQLVVNLFHVYTAMEETLDACADHPLVEPLYFPDELRRAPSLRRDAEFFYGSAWEQNTAPSKVAQEYCERLRQIATTSPELIVPHAYTRYLGDLSGGQVLKRAAVRGLKLPNDGSGVAFYSFRRINDAKAFKDMYRARLDSLPADRSTADAMVVEANLAFSLNTRMFQELDALSGFEVQQTVPVPVPVSPTPSPASAATPAGSCPFAALAASGAPMPAGHPPLAAVAKVQPRWQLKHVLMLLSVLAAMLAAWFAVA